MLRPEEMSVQDNRKNYCKIKRGADLHTKISNNEHIGIIPEKKYNSSYLDP
jgi:hypothetical protein